VRSVVGAHAQEDREKAKSGKGNAVVAAAAEGKEIETSMSRFRFIGSRGDLLSS
jgi:hypothetical protein